jgi:hypothetical protein
MKTKILFTALVLMAFASSALLSQNIAFAAPELRIETKDSVAAYELFRTKSHLRLTQYEKLMDEFSAKLAKEDQKVQDRNAEKAPALEKKDSILRVKIESYKPGEGSDWLTFKRATTLAIDRFGDEVINLRIEK